MKVKEIMKRAIVVDRNVRVKEAAKIMSEKGIGSLIVSKGKKIVGIVTEKDIIRNVDKLNKKISDIMSKDVITIDQEGGIDDAASLMAKHKIKRLPVLEDGKLVGIITATDLIANSDELNEEFFFD